MLKNLATKALPAQMRKVIKMCFGVNTQFRLVVPASSEFQIVKGSVPPKLLRGWQNPVVAERQLEAFTPLLQQMRQGNPREDFIALAKAVEMTGLRDPSIIEVGCGSGWNFEVLTYLLKRPVRYIGLDYSEAMVSLARKCYPDVTFLAGDASKLPFSDSVYDILISGVVLMHLVDYQKAIQESRRVTRSWCIFHTVPVLQHRKTTFLSKKAYGQAVIEVIFNESHLRQIFEECGLAVHHVLNSIPYNLDSVLGEFTTTKTYLCEIQR